MRKLLGLLLGLALWVTPALAVVTTTQMGNANLTGTSTDQRILLTVAFTASRTYTLPSAGGTCIGQTCPPFGLEIYDTGSAVNGANSLIIAPATGDTINGSASSVTISNINSRVVLVPTTGTNWQLVALTAGNIGQGTTTNDNACTGCVGELLDFRSTASPGTLTATTTSAPLLVSLTPAPITSGTLTAGDWDCRADSWLTPSGTATATQYAIWTSTILPSAASQPVVGGIAGTQPGVSAIQTASVTSPAWSLSVGPTRYSLAASTLINLGGVVTGSAGGLGATGVIQCRRVR